MFTCPFAKVGHAVTINNPSPVKQLTLTGLGAEGKFQAIETRCLNMLLYSYSLTS